MENIEKLSRLLTEADAIRIDDGCLLEDWDTSPTTGEPGNEIFRFDWTDGDCDYSEALTEEGVATGRFLDGKFICANAEGDLTTISFHQVCGFSNPGTGPKPARKFLLELLSSVETLGAIADQHGTRTLTDLIYLHQAILEDSLIDLDAELSKVDGVVKGMLSAEKWMKFVRPL